jgi:hypothetical protein
MLIEKLEDSHGKLGFGNIGYGSDGATERAFAGLTVVPSQSLLIVKLAIFEWHCSIEFEIVSDVSVEMVLPSRIRCYSLHVSGGKIGLSSATALQIG